MPYIKRSRKEDLSCIGEVPDNAGELNYLFTQLAIRYLGKQLNYQRINDVIGALEGAKLELYRRLASPYEDGKIEENGDVYPTSLLDKANSDKWVLKGWKANV